MLFHALDAALIRLEVYAGRNALIEVVGIGLAIVALLLGAIGLFLADRIALLATGVAACSGRGEQGNTEET